MAGIHYPPALLLLALIVLVFVAALNFSIVVSRQRRQIERLIQEVAILEAELRDLRRDQSGSPAISAGLERPGAGPRTHRVQGPASAAHSAAAAPSTSASSRADAVRAPSSLGSR